jgi:hypothetical protein
MSARTGAEPRGTSTRRRAISIKWTTVWGATGLLAYGISAGADAVLGSEVS